MERQKKAPRSGRRRTPWERMLSMFLVLCMVFTVYPGTALAVEVETAIGTEAADGSGLSAMCEKHKEHNKACGYIEAKEGAPCGHLTGEGYSCEIRDDDATPSDAEDGTPSNGKRTFVCDHRDGCGYVKAVSGVPCKHKCDLCDSNAEAPQELCSCEALCTESFINLDCPVCSAEDADLADCKGLTEDEASALKLGRLEDTPTGTEITIPLDFTKSSGVPSDCTQSPIGHTHEQNDKCFIWDKDQKTLTLNNFHQTVNGNLSASSTGIVTAIDSKIVLMGDSRVDYHEYNYNCTGMHCMGSATFSGNGSIEVITSGRNAITAIYVGNQLTISDTVRLKAVAGPDTSSISSSSCGVGAGSIVVSDQAVLDAASGTAVSWESRGISCAGDIDISGSARVTATGGESRDKDGKSCGIDVTNTTGKISVSDGATLTATGTEALEGKSYGVNSRINISGGTVEVKGKTAAMTKVPTTTNYPNVLIKGSNKDVNGSDATIITGSFTSSNIWYYKYLSFMQGQVVPAPNVSFSFDGTNKNQLMGATEEMEYSLDGGSTYEVCTQDIDLTNALDKITAERDIKVRMIPTEDSVENGIQTIDITKPEKPNLTATLPDTIGDMGSIPMTSVHEYSKDNGISWETATGTTQLEAGTYLVRVRAALTALASDSQSIKLAAKEPTPAAIFTAESDLQGRLTNVTVGMQYRVMDYEHPWGDVSQNEEAHGVVLLLRKAPLEIRIVKKGTDTTLDSDTQSIWVTKAAAPANLIKTDVTWRGNDGTIKGVDNTMEYRAKENNIIWTRITDTTLKNLAAGEYLIRVRAAGTVLTSPTTSVTIAPYVEKLPSTDDLSYNLETVTFDGTEKPVVVTKVTQDLGDITVTYNGSPTVPSNAGTYEVKVTIEENNVYPSVTLTLGSYIINKATAPAVPDESAGVMFSDSAGKAHTLKLTGVPDNMGVISYQKGTVQDADNILENSSVDSVTGTVNYQLKSGLTSAAVNKTATIPVTVTSQNYKDFVMHVKITVTGRIDVSSSITFEDGSAMYNGQAQTYEKAALTGYTGGTWKYTYTAVTGTLDNGKPKGIGTYAVTATYEAADAMGSQTASFEIKKKDVTVTITAEDKMYDGTADAAVTYAVQGAVSGETVTATGTAAFDSKAIGTGKTVTATGISLSGTAAGNYNLTSATATTTAAITAADIVPTIEPIKAMTFTGSKLTPPVTVKAGSDTLSLNTDYTVSCGDNLNAGIEAGSVTVILTGNYTGTATAKFDIIKATAAAVADNSTNVIFGDTESKSYTLTGAPVNMGTAGYVVGAVNDTNHILKSSNVDVSSGVVMYQLNSGLTSAAVNQTATIPVTVTSQNYEPFIINLVVTVTDKTDVSSSIQFADKNVAYNGEIQIYEAADVTGQTGGTWKYTYTTQDGALENGKPKSVGTYTVNASYENATATGSKAARFTIEKKEVTVTITGANKVYDGTANTTVSYTVNGAVDGDDVKATGTAAFDNREVGTGKTVTATGITLSGTAAGSYNLTSATATTKADITAKEVTPVIDHIADRAFTGSQIKPEVTVRIGSDIMTLDTDYTVNYGENINAGTEAGSVTVTMKGSYTGLSTATFTIGKKEVKVRADDQSMTRNHELPAFTVTYTGFAGTDNQDNALSAKATAITAADGKTNGSFDITFASQAVLNDSNGRNYTLTHANGTLTVSGGSSGGSGSSSGSSHTSESKPATGNLDIPAQGEIKVDISTDAGGNAVADITDQNLADAISRALADAAKTGSKAGIDLVLHVNTSTSGSTTVNLPKTVQETIIRKQIVNTIVVIDNPNINISMNLDAVKEINRQAQSDVNIIAARSSNSSLSGSAKTAIGSRPVFDLRVNYSGSKAVRNLGTGGVTVSIPYTLAEGETADSIQAVYVNSSGNVEWLANSVYDSANKVLRFNTNHFSTYGVGYRTGASLPGDSSGHWAKDDIAFAVNRGLITGTAAGAWSPDAAITRSVFITALGKLAGVDAGRYGASSFTDVSSDSKAKGYIEWAAGNNILSGINSMGEGKFAPDAPVTREEMALMMSNYVKMAGITLPKVHQEIYFNDRSQMGETVQAAVKQLQMAGIVSGKNGNLYDPKGEATRAQAAAMFRRYTQMTVSIDTAQGWRMNDSGQWLYYENGSSVQPPAGESARN